MGVSKALYAFSICDRSLYKQADSGHIGLEFFPFYNYIHLIIWSSFGTSNVSYKKLTKILLPKANV